MMQRIEWIATGQLFQEQWEKCVYAEWAYFEGD